jgi:hypothetical protein
MTGEQRNQTPPPALLPWPFAEFVIAATWMIGPMVLAHQWPNQITVFLLFVVPFLSGFTQSSWTVAGIGYVVAFVLCVSLAVPMMGAGSHTPMRHRDVIRVDQRDTTRGPHPFRNSVNAAPIASRSMEPSFE